MNAKEATYQLLDKWNTAVSTEGLSLDACIDFSGLELANLSHDIIHEYHYVGTLLRYMREYRQTHDCTITCINKRKSLYRMER